MQRSNSAVKPALLRATRALLVPALLLLAYAVGTVVWPSPFFPKVPAILAAFSSEWLGEGFVDNVLPSLSNLAAGYGLGFVLGVALGGLMGRLVVLNELLSPIVSFLLTIPPIAVLPIFLFILGIGPQFQIAAIAFGTTTYMLLNTAAAVRSVEATLEDVARVFRIDPLRRIALIIYPSALPRIIAAARVSLASALLIMVVSEMIGAARGIGATTLTAQQAFDYPLMWSGMLLVALLGVLFSYLFVLVETLAGRLLGTRISMEGD